MGAVRRNGAPGKSRTCDLLVRSQTLYPAELRAPRVTCESERFSILAKLARKILNVLGALQEKAEGEGLFSNSCALAFN